MRELTVDVVVFFGCFAAVIWLVIERPLRQQGARQPEAWQVRPVAVPSGSVGMVPSPRTQEDAPPMANDDKDDSVVGKVEEKVGWLTGDREAEAKGKLRRLKDDDDDPSAEAETETVEEAEKDVRAGYGEYDPKVDDAPPAADLRPGDTQP